jgi:hypothetical protein
MLGGRLYEAATMNQVAPRHVERRPFFFEREGGNMLPAATAAWLEQNERRMGWQD